MAMLNKQQFCQPISTIPKSAQSTFPLAHHQLLKIHSIGEASAQAFRGPFWEISLSGLLKIQVVLWSHMWIIHDNPFEFEK